MDNGASSCLRFLRGDNTAIADIINNYCDGLILYLYSIVGNYTDAEDTFVKLVTKRPKYNGKALSINQSFVDCPILKESKIEGVVTVDKERNKLYDSVADGGVSLNNLQKAFDENPNEKLVVVDDGQVPEIIISQSNKLYCNTQYEKYEKGVDYYSAFNREINSFSKDEMLNNTVTVNM